MQSVFPERIKALKRVESAARRLQEQVIQDLEDFRRQILIVIQEKRDNFSPHLGYQLLRASQILLALKKGERPEPDSAPVSPDPEEVRKLIQREYGAS